MVVNPGDYPGSCDFPFRVEYSGKVRTIDRPGDVFIFTSPSLDVTVTNLDPPENQATFNITGTLEQTTLQNGDVVTVARGRNFLIDPMAGTVIAIGNFSFVFDKKGELIQPLEGEGQLGAGQKGDPQGRISVSSRRQSPAEYCCDKGASLPARISSFAALR